MIIPLMTAELFGVQALGRLLGVILTAEGVAEAVAPWWLARLRDASGSYVTGLRRSSERRCWARWRLRCC